MISLPRVVRSLADPWATDPLVEELARRRSALTTSLSGTVLDLSGPPAVAATVDVNPDAVFDHVICTGWLAAADDLDAAAGRAVERLGEGSWLHIIEPSIGLGATARAQRMAATVGRERTGWWIDRDVAAALRRAGLVITDLERFSMPVPSVVLRPWIAGCARRPLATPFDAESAPTVEAHR